ncbi:MAG: hypothetical protein AABZ61_11185 [Bacteroidota bacterium]
MKTSILFAIALAFCILPSTASAQHKHMQMMEMLKDSVMMDLMMDHIASDNQMRPTMMDKMIYYAIGDTSRMTEMCKMMINDKRMLSMMLKMMDKKMDGEKKDDKNLQRNRGDPR